MKISLIYPYISVAERYGADIGDIGGRQAPLGILYLSSSLKKRGHEVQLIDAEAERLTEELVIERLKSFHPEFIGISITTVAYKNSLRLAGSIRKNLGAVRIVALGSYCAKICHSIYQCLYLYRSTINFGSKFACIHGFMIIG